MGENFKVGFIGGGNMAEALFGGLCRSGNDPSQILVCEPDDEKRRRIEADYGVHVTKDNEALAANCETCVIAVKPQILKDVLRPLASRLERYQPLLISIAAGITLRSLDRWSGDSCAIVRAMPNTPALVGCGATALIANDRVTPSQRDSAEAILAPVGLTTWLEDEHLMDTVTALSGSGPAYFFLVMDVMSRAAQRRGLDASTARRLCVRTALGAAKLAEHSEDTLEALRKNVTSPGGTTERGLNALMDGGLERIFENAIDAAYNRSVELSEQLGEDE
jgi:pyrroline-5-carboxylate reductase